MNRYACASQCCWPEGLVVITAGVGVYRRPTDDQVEAAYAESCPRRHRLTTNDLVLRRKDDQPVWRVVPAPADIRTMIEEVA